MSYKLRIPDIKHSVELFGWNRRNHETAGIHIALATIPVCGFVMIQRIRHCFSRPTVTVVGMVSKTRIASPRLPRTVRSAGGQRNDAPGTARRGTGGAHRSGGSNPKKRKGNNKHRILKWTLGILGTLIVLGIAAFAYLYITTDIPQPEKVALSQTTTVYYADGITPIGSFAQQNRQIINCATLPKYVGQSIVSSENRSFYTDNGIDLKGIARALLNNVTTGSLQGGSTITQQYAKQYYLGDTKSYSGKLRQALVAIKVAQTQSKSQVLCNYMNTIYLGRGAYGIQAAAKAYFNKDAKNLTLSEAAMLAGIIPAPSVWDPAVSPKQATSRFTRVIGIMKQDGYIDAKTAAAAKMPTTIKDVQQNVYSGPQGYLLQMVRNELINSKTFTAQDLDTGGYKIVTTIDKTKQDEMFQVASPSQGGAGIVPSGLQVGGMSVNPTNGSIISVYCGDDYLKKQLNNATQALYEPGSTMKPFALLATVQSGVSLNTTFNGNSPRTFTGIQQPVQNFGNQSFGYVNLYSATANSVNTVYMELQQKLGAAKVAQTAVAAGMSANLVKGTNPFTVLGNDGVHVQDVAQAYSTIANQGAKPTLHIVASVKDPQGKEMYTAPTSTQRVFAANDTALVTKAMQGTIQYGTATEALRIGKTLAGKSGTANDSTAGSFVGFTPNTVTVFAIWYPDAKGNPQPIPSFSGYSGGSDYPVHLFTKYMTQALAGTPNQTFPVATDTGKIGGPDGTWGTGGYYSYRYTATPTPTPTPTTQQPTNSPSPSATPTSPSASTSTPAPTTKPTTPAQTPTPKNTSTN